MSLVRKLENSVHIVEVLWVLLDAFFLIVFSFFS